MLKSKFLTVLVVMAAGIMAHARPDTPLSRQSPARTVAFNLHDHAKPQASPRPTDSSVVNKRFDALRNKRAASPTLSIGTDTCGWRTDDARPVYCLNDGTCTNSGTYRNCCFGGDCKTSSFFTTCLNRGAKACSEGVGQGDGTLCCTRDASKPACVSYAYSTSATPNKVFTLLGCDVHERAEQPTLAPTPVYVTVTASSSVLPTVSLPSVILTVTVPTDTLTITASRSPSATTSHAFTSSSARTSSSSSTPLSSSTPTSSAPSSTSSEPGPPPNAGESNNNSGSNVPVGAIVGGVLGGIALMGIVAVAVIYLALQHQKKQEAREEEAAVTTIPPHSFSSPPPPDMTQATDVSHKMVTSPSPMAPEPSPVSGNFSQAPSDSQVAQYESAHQYQNFLYPQVDPAQASDAAIQRKRISELPGESRVELPS